jgi:hypothetical protein
MKYFISALLFIVLLVPACVTPGLATTVQPAPQQQPVPPTIIQFSAIPLNIVQDDKSLLTWQTENATSVKIEPDIKDATLSGFREITPASTTRYMIVATNEFGSSNQTITINVTPKPPPPPQPTPESPKKPSVISFTAKPDHVYAGAPITLNWNVSGATSVTIDNDFDNTKYSSSKGSDNYAIRPLAGAVYRLVAINDVGISQATVIIKIDPDIPMGIPDDSPGSAPCT